MNPASDPNWVEFASLCVQIATVVVALLIAVSHGAQWIFWGRRIANLDRKQREIDVARLQGESVTLTGQIHDPELFAVDGDRSLPICPVFIQIKNDGAQLVRLVKVEFRVFVAPLRHVTIVTSVDSPAGGMFLAQDGDTRRVWSADLDCIVGMIDPDSPNWMEKADLCQVVPVSDAAVPPGQSRTERRHLLAPINLSPILTKVEVTVHTAQSRHRWYGFANPLMCAPEPFPSSAAECLPGQAAPEPPA